VQTQIPQGALRYWLVKASPAQFDLNLAIPDTTDAQKKRSVRAMATQTGALVAVNGGFFAYGGAAVGAVKSGNVWQRLPWKNRTALAWNNAQTAAPDAQITPLSGSCSLRIQTLDGKSQFVPAALNGFTLPGTRAEISDGYAVLTPMFARKYTLREGEVACWKFDGVPNASLFFDVQTTGDVDVQIPPFVVIARGSAAKNLDPNHPPFFSYAIQTTPDESRFGNILGAGPRLIERGEVKTNEVEEEFRPDVVARGPRTGVGWDAAGNWLLLVADGRSASSVGLTIPETAQLFQHLGAVEAMNLDGGSSTQLVVGGELLNTPSGFDPANPLRPREVQVINVLAVKARPRSE